MKTLHILLLTGLSYLFPEVAAHPGAVANGRATCGVEYSTPDRAYEIPDIQEAWYVRRVATCEAPVFWTVFDVMEEEQQLYFAVISPEISRFQDNLKFHGVLYGPGVGEDPDNGLAALPQSLPSGIEIASDLGGAAYIETPERLDTCAFVDTNPVMRQFSDLIEGRCMEEFTFEEDYEDGLQQGTTVRNWWLYSYNHRSVQPGRYYLQTWLTTNDDELNVAQGKYEITLGPWVWFGYASQATLDLAQSQGTSCACSVNALDYRESQNERIGGMDPTFHVAQLPGGSCAANPPSPCNTLDQQAYRSDGSLIEWSGMWMLEAGKTYEWTFRAYWTGLNQTYDYPDPGMLAYAVATDNLESVAAEADEIMKAAEDGGDVMEVAAGAAFELGMTQFIAFTDPLIETSTTVLFQPTQSMSIAVFTQHVPSEFMAHVLRDQATGEYLFPESVTLYSDSVAVLPPEVEDEIIDVVEGTEAPTPVSDGVARKVSWLFVGSFLIMSYAFTMVTSNV